MSGKIIPTVFGEGWRFSGFEPPPTPWLLPTPWNCQGTSGCVIALAE